MKTSTQGFARFLKNVAVFSMIAALAFSCGGDNNTSGARQLSQYGIWGGYANGATGSINTVAQANPCRTQFGGQSTGRIRLTQQLQQGSVNVNSQYVGITAEGDIAVIYNQSGVSAIDLYVCARPDLVQSSQFQLLNGVVNNSQVCQLGEITAANVVVNSQYGQYYLAFFPIQYGNHGGLCGGF